MTRFLLNRLMLADLACTLLYVIGLSFGLVAVFIIIKNTIDIMCFVVKYDVGYVARGGFSTTEINLSKGDAREVLMVLLSLVHVATTVLCTFALPPKLYLKRAFDRHSPSVPIEISAGKGRSPLRRKAYTLSLLLWSDS